MNNFHRRHHVHKVHASACWLTFANFVLQHKVKVNACARLQFWWCGQILAKKTCIWRYNGVRSVGVITVLWTSQDLCSRTKTAHACMFFDVLRIIGTVTFIQEWRHVVKIRQDSIFEFYCTYLVKIHVRYREIIT